MIEAVDVAVTPSAAVAREPAPIAVVIDVLRASTTIVAALENGATGVIPVRDPEEAMTVQRRLGRDFTRLGGEQDAKLIPGFDLDNSPASYTREKIAGRTIIMATTNGTRALAEAARGKGTVVCGALVNRGAVARWLAGCEDTEALLICAGNEGALSFEDLLAAGAIVDALQQVERHLLVSDAARIAATVWQAYGNRITTAMASSSHAKKLVRDGFSADIAACARLDVSQTLPKLIEGVLKTSG